MVRKLGVGVAGLLAMDAAFQLTPLLLPLNGVVWVVFAGVVVLVIHLIARLTGLGGLAGLGAGLHRGWLRNLGIGFLIGSGFWLGMQLVLNATKYEVTGAAPFATWPWGLVQIAVGMFLGSWINDLIVRGYVIGQLRGRLPGWIVIAISAAIYALDDIWYEGLSLNNTIFSLLLGTVLGLVVWRTGSIWANTGIHFGLNVVYSIFNGIPGQGGASGLIVIRKISEGGFWINHLSIWTAGLMLLFVLAFYRRLGFRKHLA